MKHGFAGLIYVLGLALSAEGLGSQARLVVLGPASRAVLNSTYRPIIPYHINGLTKDAKIGFDLGYRGQSRSFVEAKSSLTAADFHIYGSVPLFLIGRSSRPSGLMMKVSSISSKNIISYKNFEWEDEESKDNLKADLGFVIAPSNIYMFSIQASFDQRNEISKQRSERDLDDEVFERRQTINKTSSSIYLEYGYRLRLTRETSVGVVYSPGYYSKNGTHIREENSFIDDNTVDEYNDSAYSQGFFSIGLKTRASKPITMMLGVDRFFEVKNKNESGGELLENEYSNLGLAAEYRILTAKKEIWIPRLGFEAKSNGENQFSFGLSVQSGKFEADLAAISVSGSTDTSKNSELRIIIGLGYRIHDEDQES
ncbi:MAG: hypothetical protein AB8G05_26015 [Oligoflexales bacterium]